MVQLHNLVECIGRYDIYQRFDSIWEMALLGTALPNTLWFWLLREEDAGKLGMFLFLIPVLGLVLGVAVLGERVGLVQAAGVLVIAGGILAVAREKSPPMRSAAKHHARPGQTGPGAS